MTHCAYDMRTTHYSGIYRYGISLLRAMEADVIDGDFRLTVITWPGRSGEIIADLANPRLADRLRLVEVPDDYGFMRDSSWLRDWLVRAGVDLYYSIHYTVDPQLPVPFIFTIHDLIRLKHPHESTYTDVDFGLKFGRREYEMMSSCKGLWEYAHNLGDIPKGKLAFHRYFWAINRQLTERCERVVTVSNSVKRDIVGMLGVREDKIDVVSGAADERVFNGDRDIEAVSRTMVKYDLKPPFFLFVGLAHKRKRLDWLFSVWAGLKAEQGGCPLLVMVGDYGAEQERLERLAAANALQQHVRFLGRVDDADLANLYRGTVGLMVSSVDEGFCLPAVEALACGAEVIVPDIPIMHEVVGGQGHYYRLDDADSLARLLVAAHTEGLPVRPPAAGPKFSWGASSRRLLDIVRGYGAADWKVRVAL